MVGAPEGSCPGMLKRRTFKVVVVKGGHGVGIEESEKAELEVKYDGAKLVVKP
jgi:alpha-D-xyloside xylohydrolase